MPPNIGKQKKKPMKQITDIIISITDTGQNEFTDRMSSTSILNLLDLPDEILNRILSSISIHQRLTSLARCNKRIYSLCYDPFFLKSLKEKKYLLFFNSERKELHEEIVFLKDQIERMNSTKVSYKFIGLLLPISAIVLATTIILLQLYVQSVDDGQDPQERGAIIPVLIVLGMIAFISMLTGIAQLNNNCMDDIAIHKLKKNMNEHQSFLHEKYLPLQILEKIESIESPSPHLKR